MTFFTIAFLGIGLMGKPMATRLAQAGFTLRVWNRSHDKAAALRAIGAEPQLALADAVDGADIVISMLESGAVVAQVIEAALPALKPGTLWIDMSSTQKGEALAFYARLHAQGMRFIDAPVSGGVAGAEAGTLAIMAGASAVDFALAEPMLLAMGDKYEKQIAEDRAADAQYR